MNELKEIPKLDEREVQGDFDVNAGELVICLYSTKMWITAQGARQLRDWLSRALGE